jgi:hypothetical protein
MVLHPANATNIYARNAKYSGMNVWDNKRAAGRCWIKR